MRLNYLECVSNQPLLLFNVDWGFSAQLGRSRGMPDSQPHPPLPPARDLLISTLALNKLLSCVRFSSFSTPVSFESPWHTSTATTAAAAIHSCYSSPRPRLPSHLEQLSKSKCKWWINLPGRAMECRWSPSIRGLPDDCPPTPHPHPPSPTPIPNLNVWHFQPHWGTLVSYIAS